MFNGVRAPELLIILLVVLLIFGAAKLPALARSLGASAKEFRKGVAEGADAESEAVETEAQASEAPAAEQPRPNPQNPDS